jgi:hypothetical protein
MEAIIVATASSERATHCAELRYRFIGTTLSEGRNFHICFYQSTNMEE